MKATWCLCLCVAVFMNACANDDANETVSVSAVIDNDLPACSVDWKDAAELDALARASQTALDDAVQASLDAGTRVPLAEQTEIEPFLRDAAQADLAADLEARWPNGACQVAPAGSFQVSIVCEIVGTRYEPEVVCRFVVYDEVSTWIEYDYRVERAYCGLHVQRNLCVRRRGQLGDGDCERDVFSPPGSGCR